MKTNQKTHRREKSAQVLHPEIVEDRENRMDPEVALIRIRHLVELLDNRFAIPGTNYRVGLDAIIGLVPGLGDVVTTALAGYIVYLAKEIGIPKWLLARMIFNVSIDFVGGAVPLVGDVFDVAWKANLKNLELLERHLRKTSSRHFRP